MGKDRGISRNLQTNPAYANPWLAPFRLAKKEVAASSGAYSYGMARVVKDLPVGYYTVILSAFDPHHMGSFSLKVESSYWFDLKPTQQEGAGMYSKTVRSAWDAEQQYGGPWPVSNATR